MPLRLKKRRAESKKLHNVRKNSQLVSCTMNISLQNPNYIIRKKSRNDYLHLGAVTEATATDSPIGSHEHKIILLEKIKHTSHTVLSVHINNAICKWTLNMDISMNVIFLIGTTLYVQQSVLPIKKI